MTTKTAVLNVRTDPATKRAAQRTARDMGVSLSVVIQAQLRQFIADPHVELVPNARTRKALDSARQEARDGVTKSYDSVDTFLAELRA